VRYQDKGELQLTLGVDFRRETDRNSPPRMPLAIVMDYSETRIIVVSMHAEDQLHPVAGKHPAQRINAASAR